MTRHSRTELRTNQMLAAGMVLGAGYALARLRSPGRLRLRTPGAAATPRAPRGGARERTPVHHGVPLVPIQLDGSRVRPDKVKEFAGQPLHSVADERAMLEGTLQVFTTVEQAATYIREGQPPGPGQAGDRSTDAATAAAPLAAGAGAPPSNPLAMLTLWEHVNFTGAGWDFWGSWGAISNFTCVYPTLWWCTNINDRVSSIMNDVVSPSPDWTLFTVFFEHVNSQGSTLAVPAGGWHPDLTQFGWNDRISSFEYWWF